MDALQGLISVRPFLRFSRKNFFLKSCILFQHVNLAIIYLFIYIHALIIFLLVY